MNQFPEIGDASDRATTGQRPTENAVRKWKAPRCSGIISRLKEIPENEWLAIMIVSAPFIGIALALVGWLFR